MDLLLANVGVQKEDIVIELSFALVSLTLCFLPGIEEVSPFLPMQWRAELSPKAHLYCLLKFNASLKNRDLHMTRPFSREPRLKTSLR